MLGFLLLILIAAVFVLIVLTAIIVRDATQPVRRTGAYAAAHGLPFDPGDLGLEYEAWMLDRLGAQLAVWEVVWAPPPGTTTNDAMAGDTHSTVVLIHGWGESRIDMLRQIEFWKDFADRAVLYDLRGHGESTGTSRLGNSEDDDLIALLNRLGMDHRFILVGHELGANIALTAALKDQALQRQIAAIVAIAPYGNFHARMIERLQRREFPTWPVTNLAMNWFVLTGRSPLVITDEAASCLTCPVLHLPQWDAAAAADFLHKQSTTASYPQRVSDCASRS